MYMYVSVFSASRILSASVSTPGELAVQESVGIFHSGSQAAAEREEEDVLPTLPREEANQRVHLTITIVNRIYLNVYVRVRYYITIKTCGILV